MRGGSRGPSPPASRGSRVQGSRSSAPGHTSANNTQVQQEGLANLPILGAGGGGGEEGQASEKIIAGHAHSTFPLNILFGSLGHGQKKKREAGD